jgi:hypothetical protein
MAKGKKSSKSTSRFQAREAEPLKPFNPKSSRVNKINTVEEAFGGDEDECKFKFLIIKNDGRRISNTDLLDHELTFLSFNFF